MKFIILDLSNIFARDWYGTSCPEELKVPLMYHSAISSISDAWYRFKGDHIVVALEGRSWRKQHYTEYKSDRSELPNVFYNAINEFCTFLINKTNVTVMRHPLLEADDLIAGWTQHYPNSEHVIVSTDSDFYQLLSNNVTIFDGLKKMHITLDGFYNLNGTPVKDKKTGKIKEAPNPEWLLFEKCIRGDKTDKVFSAYPGVRTKSTKNKIGLLEAFSDKNDKGWAWNNLMLQTWVDHNGETHRVLDDYIRNKELIDLSAQPTLIREAITHTINENSMPKNMPQVGVHLMKFCGKHELIRITDNITRHVTPLAANFPQKN